MHNISPETLSDPINIHIDVIKVNIFIKLSNLLNKGFFYDFSLNVFYFYYL